MRRSATRRSLLAALAVLALAGCGGEDQRGAGQGGAAQELRVVETDFELTPAEARVERAGRVVVEVINRGRSVHALAIETQQGRLQSERVRPGASGRLEANLEAGAFTWYCPVGNHRELGMRGRITVGKGDGDAPPTPAAPSSPGY